MWKACTRSVRVGGFAVLIAATAVTAAVPVPLRAATQAVTPLPAPKQMARPSLLGGLPPASLGGPCLPSGRAYLRARIRGAVRLDIDWRGSKLKCEGAPRLDGSGIRMGFEGRVASAGQVRMIFGIDGAKAGRPGRELPTNLTVFFEDRKLLFATQGGGNCTVDRLTQAPVNEVHAPTPSRRVATKPRAYRLVAHGFCIAPANDLSGRRRILVTTFDFAGRIDSNIP